MTPVPPTLPETPQTPDDYEQRLEALVRAKRYEEAQAFAAAHDHMLAPRMSVDQLLRVNAMLEMIATAVEARAASRISRHRQRRPQKPTVAAS